MGIRVRDEGAAQVVVMDWPDKRNALSAEDGAELAEAIGDASGRACGALVLTGTGAFCAGGDLPAFAELSRRLSIAEIETHVYGRMQAVVRALRDSPVPTIAALDGPAIGLGIDYALACDMRILGPKGWLRQGWARAGLVAGVGGVGLLQRLNPSIMWRLIATQERVDGAAAERLSLGERTDGTAMDAALERAEQLAAVPRDVLAHYTRLSRGHMWPSEEHFRDAAHTQATLIGSERFRELAERVLGGAGDTGA